MALMALYVGAVGGFQTGHVTAVLVTTISRRLHSNRPHAVPSHGGSRLCTNRLSRRVDPARCTPAWMAVTSTAMTSVLWNVTNI